MMLLGTLRNDRGAMPCLIGIEKARVVVVAQDDLTRFSWPVAAASLAPGHRAMLLGQTYEFTPDLPDRFRWVMTAALQEASARRAPWWRFRKAPIVRGLDRKMAQEPLAA